MLEDSKGFELINDDGIPIRTLDGVPFKDEEVADTIAKIEAFILSVSKLLLASPFLELPSPFELLLLLLSPLILTIYNNKLGYVILHSKLDG